MKRYAIAIFVLLGGAVTVSADTYRWVDDKGVVNFTDNPDKIPAKYLKRVEQIPSVASPVPPTEPLQKSPQPADSPMKKQAAPLLYGGLDENAWRGKFGALRSELKSLQDGLPAKRDELNQLRRRWTISMGRVPNQKELGNLSKKQAEGQVEVSDNPYVNKSALSTPGKHREAYYAKLKEIESDEARISELQNQLNSLDVEASRAGVPMEWRR